MKALSTYVQENFGIAVKNQIEYMPLIDEDLTIEEALATYDNEYIDNMINEGFWDFMKSLFSSDGRKKYKAAYDDWLKGSEEAKKQRETEEKLRKEFNDKKKAILDKIKNAKNDEELAAASKELAELTKKCNDVQGQIDDKMEDLSSNAPEGAKNALAIEQFEIMLENIRLGQKSYKGLTDDSDKKTLIDTLNKSLESSSKYYALASDEVKKEIGEGIKKAEMEKIISINGDKFELNEDGFTEAASSKGETDNGGEENQNVEQQIEQSTENAIKDNADVLKEIIKAAGKDGAVKSDKLMGAVNKILQAAAKDAKDAKDGKDMKIPKSTSLGIAVMLLGATMVRKDSSKGSSYNREALKTIGEYFANNYDKFGANVLK